MKIIVASGNRRTLSEMKAVAFLSCGISRRRLIKKINERGPSTQTILAKELGIAMGQISRSLPKLESMGLIKNVIDDGDKAISTKCHAIYIVTNPCKKILKKYNDLFSKDLDK